VRPKKFAFFRHSGHFPILKIDIISFWYQNKIKLSQRYKIINIGGRKSYFCIEKHSMQYFLEALLTVIVIVLFIMV
jgi:hypothetical protein